jgi:HK97 family phage major capsid protein
MFVPELYKIPQIEDRLMDSCYVKRAVGGTAEFPRLTQTNRWGVQVYWGNEGQKLKKDNPTFNKLSVGTNRLTGLSYVSEKELRVNAVSLEAELATMFRGAMNDAISQGILTGDGTSEPTGINTTMSIALGAVVVARAVANQVSFADLNALQFAIASGVMAQGRYVMGVGGNSAYKYVGGLVDNYGRPLFRDSMREGVGSIPTLMGSPYVTTPNCVPTLGQRGDVMYGAFGNYGVAVDQEVTVARSDQFKFDEGMITFRTMAYIGGKPLGPTCFAMLGDVSGVSSSSSDESVSSSSSSD